MAPTEVNDAREDLGTSVDAGGVLDLGYLWRVVAKRRRIVGVTTGVVLALVAIYSLLATPVYTASTVLMIEQDPPDVVDLHDVLSRAFHSEGPVADHTQLDILRSRSLIESVIRDLNLQDEPRLHAGLLSDSPAPASANGGIDPRLIDRYAEQWLEILPAPESRLVTVAISTPDADLSARIANAHAQAYVRYGLDLRTQASMRAVDFLQGTLDELGERAAGSSAKLQGFREAHGVVSAPPGGSLVIARLSDLQQRLTEAEAKRIALETQVQLLDDRGLEALPAVRQSALISSQKAQLAQLENQLVSATANLRPKAPQPLDLIAQVDAARRQLSQELHRIGEGIRSEYLAAKREEEQLRARLEEQQRVALAHEATTGEYAVLEHEANANRQLLQTVEERMKEMSVLADVQASSTFVIDEAHPPRRPSRPRLGLNLAGGLAVGLFLGLWLAFAIEALDNRLRRPEDAERYLQLPSLGLVPDLAGLARRGRALESASRPLPLLASSAGARTLSIRSSSDGLLAAAAGEAYRSIRTSLLLSQPGEDPRTILFTSATDQEGKTTTAINMALVYAQLDSRVLLIDADLRHRRCGTLLGVESETGLCEILAGRVASFRPIRSEKAPIDVLPSGAVPPDPAKLLGSQAMRKLLALLRERYAYVVIDSPPLMPVGDALVLSTIVDGVVLVVDAQRAPRQMVREARNRLVKARAKLLGFVMNRVDAPGPVYAYYSQDFQGTESKQSA